MPKQKKPKIGRPTLPKGEAKGKILPIRVKPEDMKRIENAAKSNKQTVSEWIRAAISAAMPQ